jgi:hypothetical protein
MADTFNIVRDKIEVTMLRRPDPSWVHVDSNGHEHRWYVDGSPANDYSPSRKYELPTLEYVVDEEATDEWPEVAHYECRICRSVVQPWRTSDTTRQYIQGPISRFEVNGIEVTPEEFKARAIAAHPEWREQIEAMPDLP